MSFQCRPTLKGLIGQLDNVRKHFGGIELKLCYEASYVGFSLQRDLRRHIQSLLRRNGLHDKAECASKTHWRTHHYGWLDRTIADCTGSLKVNLFALTMITEIGDVKRFAHPRQLVSWAGMDVREYAFGGKSNRLGITRQVTVTFARR